MTRVMPTGRLLVRAAWPWGIAIAAVVAGRESLDWWLSPTDDFYARSIASTAIAIALYVAVGVRAGWRARRLATGALIGLVTGGIAAAATITLSALQLAVRHDPHTMQMIAASGGLAEVFLLPILVIVPGTIASLLGGALAVAAATLYSPSANTKSA